MKHKRTMCAVSGVISGVARQLGVIVHVTATYLGIAVMVVMACGLVLQPVRDQMGQALDVVLQTVESQTSSATMRAFPDLADLEQNSESQTPAAALDSADEVAILTSVTPGETLALEDLRRDFDRILDADPNGLKITGISSTQFQSLRRYLARRYRVAQNVASALIQTAYALGQAQGVDPQLLLAIIAIESRYNPYAESHVGAQGLMQVMPHVHRDKFDALGLDISAAVEPVPNMIVGTKIYTDCRKRRGSVAGALSCYVGATGSDGGYGAKVLSEHRRIARATRITAQGD